VSKQRKKRDPYEWPNNLLWPWSLPERELKRLDHIEAVFDRISRQRQAIRQRYGGGA
jgi:hypothetical protein